MKENWAIFFNGQEFASEAMIRGQRIAGLENSSRVISNEVATQKTTFTCESQAVLAIRQGESIRLGEQVYHIVGLQADGTGLTTFILEKIG